MLKELTLGAVETKMLRKKYSVFAPKKCTKKAYLKECSPQHPTLLYFKIKTAREIFSLSAYFLPSNAVC